MSQPGRAGAQTGYKRAVSKSRCPERALWVRLPTRRLSSRDEVPGRISSVSCGSPRPVQTIARSPEPQESRDRPSGDGSPMGCRREWTAGPRRTWAPATPRWLPMPFPWLHQHAYAYLLGLYLGDGHLIRMRRNVFALRIFLDAKYPLIYRRGCWLRSHLTNPTGRARGVPRSRCEDEDRCPATRNPGRVSFLSTAPASSTFGPSCSQTGSARSAIGSPTGCFAG